MHIKLIEKKVNDADQRALRKEAGERDCSYINAKKSRRAVICLLIVIYCDPAATRADDPDICMRNWRWHKGMNLLTHGWTHEQENGAYLTQLYVEQWSGIGRVSPCWHVDTYHLYLIMSVEDQPRERAVCGEKTQGARLRFLPSIRRFARHSRPGTRQIEGVSRGGI